MGDSSGVHYVPNFTELELDWDETPVRDTVHEVPTVDEEREALPPRWREAVEMVRGMARTK